MEASLNLQDKPLGYTSLVGIDLIEVRQKQGTSTDILWKATWNDQHRPLTVTDAVRADDTHLARAVYSPYGQREVLSDETPYTGFAGMRYHAASGLYLTPYRAYDPKIGRWLSQDPIGGGNLYNYAGCRPGPRIDPLGLLDVFIGGFFDATTLLVKDYYNDTYKKTYPGRNSAYFSWTDGTNWIGGNDIIDKIVAAKKADSCEPINLIGHSYGGETAASVSRQLSARGITVDLLVTIDPVSKPDLMEAGVARQWINVNAKPDSSDFSDGVAWWGGKWGDWPGTNGATAHYDANYHHAQFGDLFEHPNGGSSALSAVLNSNCACK